MITSIDSIHSPIVTRIQNAELPPAAGSREEWGRGQARVAQVSPEFPGLVPARPIDDVIDIVSLLEVKVVGGSGRANVGAWIRVCILSLEEQRNAALCQVWQSKLSRKTAARLDREFRRVIFTEVATRIAQAQVIDQSRCEDVVET